MLKGNEMVGCDAVSRVYIWEDRSQPKRLKHMNWVK